MIERSLATLELDRFLTNREQGRAPNLWLTLHIHPDAEPTAMKDRLLAVIAAWLAQRASMDAEQLPWPSDDDWQRLLPPWFVQTFEGHPPEEIHQSDWLWDYGSWLDSMHDRVWRWWGYRLQDEELVVELQLDSWPFSLGALEYVVKVAGGEVSQIGE